MLNRPFSSPCTVVLILFHVSFHHILNLVCVDLPILVVTNLKKEKKGKLINKVSFFNTYPLWDTFSHDRRLAGHGLLSHLPGGGQRPF